MTVGASAFAMAVGVVSAMLTYSQTGSISWSFLAYIGGGVVGLFFMMFTGGRRR